MNKRLLNVKEASQYLSISRALLYQLSSAGKVKSVRIKTRRLFDVRDLNQYVDQQKKYGG